MGEDFLDLIDQAFLEGQIDGEMMLLACYSFDALWPDQEIEYVH